MRMLAGLVVVAAIVTSATSATAGPCDNAMAQNEMNSCFCGEREKADAKLNEAYQKVLKDAASEPLAVEKLKAAQRAWVRFRDAHLAALHPAERDPTLTYGSMYPMCTCLAETRLIHERLAQLHEMLDPKEGDGCN